MGTTTGETTSYIQIFKKKQIMSPRFMAETAATSGFFRKNSQNKEGVDHHGRNYKLHPNFQKEEKIKSTVHGRNYSYTWIFPKEFQKLKKHCPPRTKLQATSRFPKRRKSNVHRSWLKLQLQVDFSERIPKIKKALAATDETTSYIKISKKKKK